MIDFTNVIETLNNYKGSEKKKSGWMERLEQMQREQQRLAREQAKAQMKR